ncbi:ELM1/GtrOC1 family putative glycosyltransferase [Caulobacter vibrioides]|uniref:ELM1/GtrOC1 family putative glycosyltransferase n=1 Tax=Caulobacter vibrioides TaxID=155892 RepID=UPI002351CD4A|nr:ELM1/GtrOC1 family putative glycosyltransferase [Caulobacter vibrioides]
MTKANPPPSKTSPLKVWAVSDGRAGIEAQVVGLAEAISRLAPCEVTVKRVGWQGNIGRLPWWLNLLPKRWLTPESGLPAGRNPDDWPDLWIAAGRATLPLSIRAKRWSGGKSFVVQIQDPRVPPHMFDLVIPPKHDRMSGDNILPITGSPHRVTQQRLAAEYEAFQDLIEPPTPAARGGAGGRQVQGVRPLQRAGRPRSPIRSRSRWSRTAAAS